MLFAYHGDVKKVESFIEKFKDSGKIVISETELNVTRQTKQDDEICTPTKIFNHSSASETCSSYELWVAYPRHVLTIKDKAILEPGEQLNDKHNKFYLLNQQFLIYYKKS